MFNAMTIPGDISIRRFRVCVRPTSCNEFICIDASSPVLGRKLVYVNLYIISARKSGVGHEWPAYTTRVHSVWYGNQNRVWSLLVL